FERLARPDAVRQSLEEQLVTMLPVLQRLPRRLSRITEDLETGRFSVRVRMFAEPDDRRFVTDLVQQVVVAVLAAAITVGAVVLLVSDGGARLTASLRLYDVLGALFLLFGFVLGLRALIRVFATGSRPRR